MHLHISGWLESTATGHACPYSDRPRSYIFHYRKENLTAIQLNYLREHWHKQQLMLGHMCAWMAPKVIKKEPNLYTSDLETRPLGCEYCLKLG
jgi:hypothetical protein